ncbi:MAG: VOC family protein [Nitriliruptorales bacterium]|nr:VOC family protein [Nitriliruptorales bacterium]
MVRAIPEGRHAITPHLVCSPCGEALDFYKRAFGAEQIGDVMTGPDGSVGHAEMRIGDSVFMLADEWPGGPAQAPTTLGGSTAVMFLYTEDVDTMWEQAIAAGAEEVIPLELQFYGDKSGRIRDPFGHTWGLAQHVEDVDDEEMDRRVAQFYEDNPPPTTAD